MTKEAPTYKRGLRNDCVQYFYAYPNRIVTLRELEKHFKGAWNHTQIVQAMADIVRSENPIERIQQHVWRLIEPSQEPIAAKVLLPEEKMVTKDIYDMNVTVIKSVDDGSELVVVDDFTNIWRMVKVS